MIKDPEDRAPTLQSVSIYFNSAPHESSPCGSPDTMQRVFQHHPPIAFLAYLVHVFPLSPLPRIAFVRKWSGIHVTCPVILVFYSSFSVQCCVRIHPSSLAQVRTFSLMIIRSKVTIFVVLSGSSSRTVKLIKRVENPFLSKNLNENVYKTD